MLKVNSVSEMEKEIHGKTIKLIELQKEKTALVVVDMVNGFVHNGPLSSPRIVDIIEEIHILNENTIGYEKIFFLDEHQEGSTELITYPCHCLKGTAEAEIISELKNCTFHTKATVIFKNSTNGFHASGFKEWLNNNIDKIENYIVVGCEADICVSHFATTLKTFFNENNFNKRIIVPINAVETFDLGTHNGDLMKVISLWEMQSNGIEIVEKIEY